MVNLRAIWDHTDRIEREIYFKSHISLWEHSSHFRLIGRGVPSVSVVSQLMYKFLCLASPKENPHVKDQESNPRPHTPRPAALPVKVEQRDRNLESIRVSKSCAGWEAPTAAALAADSGQGIAVPLFLVHWQRGHGLRGDQEQEHVDQRGAEVNFACFISPSYWLSWCTKRLSLCSIMRLEVVKVVSASFVIAARF